MEISKSIIVFLSVVIACTATVGCKKKEEAVVSKQEAVVVAPSQGQQLAILKFGPNPVKAGEVFNKQPNGESAIWIAAQNVTNTTVINFNGTELKTVVDKQNNAAAIVPSTLYNKAGELPVFLLDKQTGAKSNEVKFIVQ